MVETDEKGNQLSVKVYICTGPNAYSSSPITEVVHEYDDLSNLVKTRQNGKLVYEAEYEGTHLVKAIGQDGTTFEYDYDSLERMVEVIRWGAPAYGITHFRHRLPLEPLIMQRDKKFHRPLALSKRTIRSILTYRLSTNTTPRAV